MNGLNFSAFDGLSGPSLFAVLLTAKVTALLAIAWLAHLALGSANPRWRVLLWRAVAAGTVTLITLALCPPLWSLAVLPVASDEVSGVAQLPVASPVSPGPSEREGSASKGSAFQPIAPERLLRTDMAEPLGALPGPISEAAMPLELPEAAGAAPATALAPMAERRLPRDEHSASSPSALSLASWIAAIWLVGVLACALYRTAGLWHLMRVMKGAGPVPEWIGSEAGAVAQRLAIRRRFAVCQTESLPVPCLVGLFRPVVLLPHGQCERSYAEELPAILAHELAHLKGGDLAWSRFLHGLSILLWFHPFAWRLPRVHGDACDAVCDAVAADYVGDAGLYGRTLARLALRLATAGGPVGLAMARKSNVRRRVEALERFVFRTGLPRWRMRTALLAATAAVLLLGGLALTRSSAAPAEEESEAAAKESPDKAAGDEQPAESVLTIRCVADETGQPLTGVKLEFDGRIGGEDFKRSLQTAADGTAEMKWPTGAEIETLHMITAKAGYTPIQGEWDNSPQVTELPDRVELRLVEAIRIGGVVQDEEGKPVAEARLSLGMEIERLRQDTMLFVKQEIVADENGRWEWQSAPKHAEALVLWSIGPGFFLDAFGILTAGTDNVITVQRAKKVTGRVLDTAGRPVGGAVAQFGYECRATTGEDGRFVIENCRPGPGAVVVRAEGLAVQALEVTAGEQEAPLEFHLEPGHVLRGRVVDAEGRPLEGVSIQPTSWRGNRIYGDPIETDKEGRFRWRGAPADAAEYYISKPGYMAQQDVPFMVSEEELVITLYPQLIISGRVTDAETGELLPEFHIQYATLREVDRPIFWRGNLLCKAGSYTFRTGYLVKGWQVQAVAPGYLPEASRVFDSTEGQQTWDFQLKRGSGPEGTVLLPDGEPAAGVQVALTRRGKEVGLRKGRLYIASRGAFLVEADGEGRFSFPAFQEEEFLIVAAGEAGYVEVTSEEFASSKRFRLKPWGRLEGMFKVRNRPGAGYTFQFHPSARNATDGFVSQYGCTATTDDEGRFEIEHVVPGPGTLSLVMIKHFQSDSTSCYYSRQRRVEITAGETTRVAVGGTGRPVKGRFVLDWKPETPIDWTTSDPVEIETWDRENNRLTRQRVKFVGFVDEAGRFEIPDVPAGDYRLRLPINLPPNPQGAGAGDEIGRAELVFNLPDMPGGRSDEPLDLGTIETKRFDSLDPGEIAPEFVVQGLKGEPVRLANHRGKLVLLNFWSPQNERSLDQMVTLKAVHEALGANPRFAMVSVACDSNLARSREYVENLHLDWEQAYERGLWMNLAKSYSVRSLPACFLISPDGHVLAKIVRGDDVKLVVSRYLADDKLFRIDPNARPQRFPVTRFDLSGDQPAVQEQPAVVALSTISYEKDATERSQGSLRAFTATGEELWKHAGIEAGNIYGSYHSLAVDRRRDRIYASGNETNTVHAFTLDGRKVWRLDNLRAGALVVDEKTGDLWCRANTDETVVFDQDGSEKTSLLYAPIDMAYNPKSDSFWLAGSEILVLSREGEVQFRQAVDGECNRVAVNPQDGSVWFVEVEESNFRKRQHRLHVWNVDGTPRRMIDVGERGACTIACLPEVDQVWVGFYPQGLQRYSSDGELLEELAIEGRAIAVSPTTGEIWRNTPEAIIRTDAAGRILAEAPHERPFPYWSWVVAF